MENHNKGRAVIYTLGGGYLVYLAYKLFTSGSAGGNAIVSMVFSAFFLLMGIVILGFAIHVTRKGTFRNESGEKGKEENLEDSIDRFEGDTETIEK